jgi:hypothetical protein
MELKEIEAVHAHSRERDRDRISTTRLVIRPGCGTHFVNAWISESRSTL